MAIVFETNIYFNHKKNIRNILKTKLREFNKGESLSSTEFIYSKNHGQLVTWLMFHVGHKVRPFFSVDVGISNFKKQAVLSLSGMSTITDSDCFWQFDDEVELHEKFDIFLELLRIVLPLLENSISQIVDEYGADCFDPARPCK